MDGEVVATAISHQVNEAWLDRCVSRLVLASDFLLTRLVRSLAATPLVWLIGQAHFGFGSSKRFEYLALPARQRQSDVGLPAVPDSTSLEAG